MVQESSAPAAIPSGCDAPDLGLPPHGIACARPSGSLRGWRVSQQLGVLQRCVPSHPALSALGGGQHEGCMVGRAVPSTEDGRKRPVTHGVMVASPGGRRQAPGLAG